MSDRDSLASRRTTPSSRSWWPRSASGCGEASQVRPEDHHRHAETLRELLPTIELMADLPGADEADRPSSACWATSGCSARWAGAAWASSTRRSRSRWAGGSPSRSCPTPSVLDPRHLQRFQLEAQAAASLNHPHIVPVFATGSAEGMPYYAMRFIDGRDLARVIRELRRDELADTEADPPRARDARRRSRPRGPRVAREVARLARQAAEALDHAHASDVLHRDIKPSNLMIDGAGELWITDFGLARVRGGLDLTHTGDAAGYSALHEPRAGAGTADAASTAGPTSTRWA